MPMVINTEFSGCADGPAVLMTTDTLRSMHKDGEQIKKLFFTISETLWKGKKL